MRDLEDLGNVGALEVLPVEKFECDLQVEGESPQSTKQDLLLLAVDDDLRWRSIQDDEPVFIEVARRILFSPTVAISEKLLAGDREEKSSETRIAAEALSSVHAAKKRLLHEVVDIPADLVAKEPVQ